MTLFSCKNPKFDLSKIKQVSKLATVEFVVAKTVYGQKEKKLPFIPIRLNRASFMAFTEARIKAGIDLDKLLPKDVKVEGDKISILLPPIEILNFSYPSESFVEDKLYTNQRKFLNHISVLDQEDLFRQADLSIRNQIADLGIEKAAQKNARFLLKELLTLQNFTEISIEFKPSKKLKPSSDFKLE